MYKKMHANKYTELLEGLYHQGLSNYYVLHQAKDHLFFGNLEYEKGHLAIKDSGLLKGIKPSLFEPIWQDGIVGMICNSDKYNWESLTFLGLENCKLKPNLSQTRNNILIATENQDGESIIDFKGSIYRGLQLLLDNNFIPVILLNPVESRDGEQGLIVSDLHTAQIEIKLLLNIHDLIMKSVENYEVLQVDDLDVSASEFHKYFDGLISDAG